MHFTSNFSSMPSIHFVQIGYLALPSLCFASLLIVWRLIARRDPLRVIPGPPSSHFLWGNERDLFYSAPGQLYRLWYKKYGAIYKFTGAFGRKFLCISDPVAVHHILGPARFPSFPKPAGARAWFNTIVGPGLLYVEDRIEHRRLRKLVSANLSVARLEPLVDRFSHLSSKVAGLIDEAIGRDCDTLEIDFAWWSTRYALDAICSVGFDYDIDAFSEDSTLPNALDRLNHSEGSRLAFVMRALFWMFPSILHMPSEKATRIKQVRSCFDAVSQSIIQTRSEGGVFSFLKDIENGESEDTEFAITQVRTLISAAYETVSATVSWMMYEISRDQELQERLRSYICSAEEHEGLWQGKRFPLLDAVYNETLRIHPPVSVLHHVASDTTIVPTSTGQIPVPRGTVVAIQVNAAHRDEAVWGSDCDEFRPERWLDRAQRSESLLAFSQGTRVCMGRNFAEMEIKILVIELLRRFRVEVTKPAAPYQAFVVRPVVKEGLSEMELPLVFTRRD